MSGILIVEDEVITAMDLRETLHYLGYTVIGAVATGEAAIAMIEKDRPDLVLMDILLDGSIDGINAAEIIRSRYAIPVIFATSQTDDATVSRAMSASPYGFIVKPFETRELHATIQTVLTRHSLEMELTKREKELARANKVLVTMSDIRIAMIESPNETRFLQKACDRVVSHSGAAFAWIGYSDKGELKKIHPIAMAGDHRSYLDGIDVRWDDSEKGQSPAGKVIRHMKSAVINNISIDPSFSEWKDLALRHGFNSIAAEPLICGNGPVGVLSVYSSEPNYFDNSMILFLRDISSVISQGILTMRTRNERQIAEKEVRDLHGFYEKILENVTEGILVIDSEGILSYVNGAVTDITGQRKEEFVGGNIIDIFPGGTEGMVYLAYREARENRTTVSYDRVRVVRSDGREEFRGGQMIPLLVDGNFESMIWTMRDITEEVRAERWRYLYNLLAENSRDVILFVEKDSRRIIEANDAAVALYGFSLEELATMRITDLRVSDMEDIVQSQIEKRDGNDLLFETAHRVKNGSVIPVEVSMRGITIGDEHLEVNIVRDIRERKELQRQVLELGDERRRRIGRDLHDSLGQMLTGVALLVRSARKSADRDPSTVDEQLKDIEKNVKSAIEVTRNLARGLTLIEPGEKGLIDGLQELAENTGHVAGISCTFTSDSRVKIMNDAVAQHLYYVSLEAVNNAVRHGGGDQIVIDLRAREPYLYLEVRDNGTFSRSEDSRGIGLRTMDYRARLFGGYITLVREEGWTSMLCRMNLNYCGSQR
ncbi:MAG TPA: PAS domain S-box protein [Spirochaetota bacterium]